MKEVLRNRGRWFTRLTGYSPTTGHAEPGWAADLPLEEACQIDTQFHQDAIYFIIDGFIYVTHYCLPSQRQLLLVASFQQRLDTGSFTRVVH